MRQRYLFLLTVSTILFVASLGWAQATSPPSADAKKLASSHFARGVELFEEGAFRAALIEFDRAYEVAPDFRLLYNIGHAHLELHDWLHATQAYERYISDGGGSVPVERRREVESILSSLADRVGRLSIHVNVQDAEVFVDDQRVGVAPLSGTVPTNVGRHRVYAHTASGSVGEKVVDVAGGDLVEVSLELAAAPAPQLVTVAAPTGPRFSRMQRGALASWILVAPFAAGAIATGLIASNKLDDRDALLSQQGTLEGTDSLAVLSEADRKEASDLKDSARVLAITSDVMTGVSVALAVTGLVLWLRGTKEDKDEKDARKRKSSLSWGVGLGAASVKGHF